MPAHRPRQDRSPRQLALVPRGWGGRRAGAGRKPSADGRVPHRARPKLASRYPVHVTLRVRPDVPSLHGPSCGPAVARALRTCSGRDDFRLVHFCVLSNHLHLLCEAHDQGSLARGLRALSICLARGINTRLDRRGPLLVGRYHARILHTPLEVQRALLYVLNNARGHERDRRARRVRGDADRWSSGRWFDGWREPPRNGCAPPAWAPASRTWLLARGWRRHGLLCVDATPGSAPTRRR